jgi:hypothetical protein
MRNMPIQQEPLGEDILLLCPRCQKQVAKIHRVLFERIKKDYSMFCVYHPECEGIKTGEVLRLPSDWLQGPSDGPEVVGGAHKSTKR